MRIIAATNTDLKAEVAEGRFREDLYYRLSDYEIVIPPLRDRHEDIVLLIEFFIHKYAYLNPGHQFILNDENLNSALRYAWPGNIRELESHVKRCIINATNGRMEQSTLAGEHLKAHAGPSLDDVLFQDMQWKKAKHQIITRFETNYLQCLLTRYHGVVVRCARHAGMQPADFWKMLKKYNLNAQQYRI